jgi:hypothetical protein
MKITNYSKFRFLFAAMAAVALVLAVIGMADISSTPYSGYKISPDYKVICVDSGSPAAMARMEVGDRIVEVAGTPTAMLYQLSKQLRPNIGEEQKIAVIRGQTRHELVLRQVVLPLREWFLAWGRNLVALAMLTIGLIIFWSKRNKSGSLFFLCNLGIALFLMTPPYLESYLLRTVVALNAIVFLMMGLTFFLHLSVIFPKPKPAVVETPLEYLIYGVAPLVVVYYMWLRILLPEADLLVNQTLHYAFGLLVLLCLGFGLAALAHSYWKATSFEEPQGLGLLLLGSLVGIVPPAVGLLTYTFLPKTVLPGSEYYPLLVLITSLSFARALWRVTLEERAV